MDPRPTPAWAQRPAPEPLNLIQEFVNTHAYGDYPEQLSTASGARSWFRARSLVLSDLNEQALGRILEIRELLRTVLLGHAGHADAAKSARGLQHALRSAAVHIRIDENGGASAEALGTGLQHFQNRLAAQMLSSSIDGTWARLKACGNDECQVAFYDHSRNGTARYCTTAICANRVRQRAFRERME